MLLPLSLICGLYFSMENYGLCMRDAGCDFSVYYANLYACFDECRAADPGAVCPHPGVKSNRRIKAVLRSKAITQAKNTVLIALTNTGYVPYIVNLHQSLKHLKLEKHLVTFAIQQQAKHKLEEKHIPVLYFPYHDSSGIDTSRFVGIADKAFAEVCLHQFSLAGIFTCNYFHAGHSPKASCCPPGAVHGL